MSEIDDVIEEMVPDVATILAFLEDQRSKGRPTGITQVITTPVEGIHGPQRPAPVAVYKEESRIETGSTRHPAAVFIGGFERGFGHCST